MEKLTEPQKTKVIKAIETLSDCERTVVENYFGINCSKLSLEEIAQLPATQESIERRLNADAYERRLEVVEVDRSLRRRAYIAGQIKDKAIRRLEHSIRLGADTKKLLELFGQ